MELVENSKALNYLVPKLINKTEDLQKELKTRMKLNKIFSEFENKASTQLNYFIKNSNKRYNFTKYGCDLDSFLLNNNNSNLDKVNKIINDKFYSDTNIQKEKQKLKYKSTSKIYKDIQETFNEMKLPLGNNGFKHSKKNIELIMRGLLKKTKKQKLIKKPKKIDEQIIKKHTYVINYELKKDEVLIKNSVNKYLNKVNNPSRNSEELFVSASEILSSTPYRKKPNIDLPHIKLINYSHKRPIKKCYSKKRSISNINMLIPYSRMGQFLNKKKEKKEISLNNNEKSKIPFLTEANIRIIKIDDFSNTANIVYNSANKELQSKSNFDRKRRKFNKIFGFNKLPLLDSYDDILLQKSQIIKTERENKDKKLYNKQKYAGLVGQEKATAIINDEINMLDNLQKNICKKLNTYNNKKEMKNDNENSGLISN